MEAALKVFYSYPYMDSFIWKVSILMCIFGQWYLITFVRLFVVITWPSFSNLRRIRKSIFKKVPSESYLQFNCQSNLLFCGKLEVRNTTELSGSVRFGGSHKKKQKFGKNVRTWPSEARTNGEFMPIAIIKTNMACNHSSHMTQYYFKQEIQSNAEVPKS